MCKATQLAAPYDLSYMVCRSGEYSTDHVEASQEMATWYWTEASETITETAKRQRTYSVGEVAPQPPRHSHRLFSSTETDSAAEPHFRWKRRTKSPLPSLRNFSSMAALGGFALLLFVGFAALQGAKPRDVREIDSMIQRISYSKAEERERLLGIKTAIQAGNAPAHRVLVLGMAESLSALLQNANVIGSIAGLCWVYEGRGIVDVQVLYKRKKVKEPLLSDEENASILKSRLENGGCHLTLEPEDVVWQNWKDVEERKKAIDNVEHLSRYKRLAKLRSLHRRRILDKLSSKYNVVVNVDLDVVEMPPVIAMLRSIDRMVADDESGAGNVVCANGFETWAIGTFRRQMFYDTLAAVDANGNWAFPTMTNSFSGVIKFAQNTFLRDILRQGRELWPMQSCFGGVAMYDYQTWGNTECDYDPDRIQYIPPHVNPVYESQTLRASLAHSESADGQRRGERWSLDPKFTLGNGDTCEHVVFQQCLYDQSGSRGQRSLKIGIQPDLVIQREALILGRVDDVTRLLDFLGRLVFHLTLVALIMLPVHRAALQFYAKQQPEIMRHIHEA
jgi:hypothetical protein